MIFSTVELVNCNSDAQADEPQSHDATAINIMQNDLIDDFQYYYTRTQTDHTVAPKVGLTET